MPNRILKQSICTSRNINALSLGAESLFYRILVNCDDYGRFHADTSILRGFCFPLRKVDEEDIFEWLKELCAADLVWTYSSDGADYLQVTKWDSHQQIRAKRSKFPEPPADDINGNPLPADAPVIQSNPIQSNPNPNTMAATPPPAPEPEQTLPDEPKVKSDDKQGATPKPKRAAPVPKPDLLVTTIPHGAELQTALDAHFAGLQNPHPAWTVFASLTQRNAYAKVAVELDGELVKLATSGLAKGASDRGRLLSWLEGCAKKRRDGTGGNHAARQSVQTKSGNPNAGRYEHKPFDPTRQRVTPVS